MIQKLINFVQRTPNSDQSNNVNNFPHIPEIHREANRPLRNDATRPSHRVGKHKITDIYKALDMGG